MILFLVWLWFATSSLMARRKEDREGDPVARSDALDAALEDPQIAEAVEGLIKYGQRNRALVKIALASVAFDILLSGGLAVATFKAVHASHEAQAASSTASQNQRGLLVTCLAGNDARAAQRRLWSYVLDLSASTPPRPGATADEIQRGKLLLDQFRQYIADQFTDRDCSQYQPKGQRLPTTTTTEPAPVVVPPPTTTPPQ